MNREKSSLIVFATITLFLFALIISSSSPRAARATPKQLIIPFRPNLPSLNTFRVSATLYPQNWGYVAPPMPKYYGPDGNPVSNACKGGSVTRDYFYQYGSLYKVIDYFYIRGCDRELGQYDVKYSESKFKAFTIITRTPIAGLSFESTSPDMIGETTHFTATVTAGDDVNYAWDFGDFTIGNGKTTDHLYEAAINYTVTLTATNAVGQEVTTGLVSITEIDTPIAGLSFESTSPDLLGETTHFTAAVTAGTNVVYSWEFGNGVIGNGQTTDHLYAAAIDYTVTLTATNGVGQEVTTGLVSISETHFNYLPAVVRSFNNAQLENE